MAPNIAKNGSQGLQKNPWRPVWKSHQKGLTDLCGRECVGKSCTKNFLGMFGEIRAKNPSQPQKFAYSSTYYEKSPPLLPFWNDRGMNASIFRRPCAHYSARTLFTPCCWLQFVTVMNINYRRYPKTEQFIPTKISGNALKRSRTPSVLRQNTLSATSAQFATATIQGCANVSSNCSRSERMRLGWRSPRVDSLKLAKLHKNWECA